jgi:hypothetical protein
VAPREEMTFIPMNQKEDPYTFAPDMLGFIHMISPPLMGTIVKGQSRAILPIRFPRCRASSAH